MSADDWRLTGQDKYLREARLKWTSWTSSKPGWDHDHCEFCTAEISDRPVDEHTSYNAGWVSVDERHWVCPECFEDFRVSFGWTIESSR